MRRALQLAEHGRGRVSPNPTVGAVLVRDGTVIGEGYHAVYGGPHAETECIRDAYARGNDPRGATMYCTLEPCSFRSPNKHNAPCTDAILEAGISRLVVAARDPNPAVSGRGVQVLRDAGLEVICGLLERRALEADEAYFVSVAGGRPMVHLKWAQSLNGRIARAGGGKTAISGPEALRHAHGIRAQCDAILVGRGTVALDDPSLTVRHADEPPGAGTGAGTDATEQSSAGHRAAQPIRVVLDPELKTSNSARMLEEPGETWIVIRPWVSQLRRRPFERPGVTLIELPPTELPPPTPNTSVSLAPALFSQAPLSRLSISPPSFSIAAVLDALYRRGVRSVLVEGGSETHRGFLDSGLWDRLSVYIGPALLDGEVLSPACGAHIADTEAITERTVTELGNTVCISGLNSAAAARLETLRWEFGVAAQSSPGQGFSGLNGLNGLNRRNEPNRQKGECCVHRTRT